MAAETKKYIFKFETTSKEEVTIDGGGNRSTRSARLLDANFFFFFFFGCNRKRGENRSKSRVSLSVPELAFCVARRLMKETDEKGEVAEGTKLKIRGKRKDSALVSFKRVF